MSSENLLKEFSNGFQLTFLEYRKMVNVASRTPFNLHNKVLPPEWSYGSVSQSTSRSFDQHPRDHNYQTDYSNHVIARQRNFYASAFNDELADGSRSTSPSSGPTGPLYTRCLPQTLDHSMPNPILNVRLVGYTDNMTKSRGRPRDRFSLSTVVPRTHGTTRAEDGGVVATTENTETSCEGLVRLFCAIELFIQLTLSSVF